MLVGKHLDDCLLARGEQPGPIGRDLAPELLAWPLADEGTLGAVALDEAFAFQHVESFPDGRAGHAAFGRQVIHGGRSADQ